MGKFVSFNGTNDEKITLNTDYITCVSKMTDVNREKLQSASGPKHIMELIEGGTIPDPRLAAKTIVGTEDGNYLVEDEYEDVQRALDATQL